MVSLVDYIKESYNDEQRIDEGLLKWIKRLWNKISDAISDNLKSNDGNYCVNNSSYDDDRDSKTSSNRFTANKIDEQTSNERVKELGNVMKDAKDYYEKNKGNVIVEICHVYQDVPQVVCHYFGKVDNEKFILDKISFLSMSCFKSKLTKEYKDACFKAFKKYANERMKIRNIVDNTSKQ